MADIEERLDKIHAEIKKNLYLQGELKHQVNTLNFENQELKKNIETLKQRIVRIEEESKNIDYQVNDKKTQKNQLINKKIEELLSEVEKCMVLLKK